MSTKKNSNRPYHVFGYDALCEDFDFRFESFVEAVKLFIQLNKDGMYVVFISGVSEGVQRKLNLMT